MKLRTLIIDDEPIALEKLKSYVDKVAFLELAGACSNGLDAMRVMSEREIDVVFTDINMPDLNGVDFVESLPHPPMVVFTTAYSEYAVDSYRLSAVDYLPKPYGFKEFQRAANRVLAKAEGEAKSDVALSVPVSSDGSIFVKVDYRFVRVALGDIRYIKGYGEYLQIYLRDAGMPLTTLSSFNAVKSNLSDNFLQVHRSYIVNMNQVEQISRGRVIMDSDTYIPVGDSYKGDLQAYLSRHAIGYRKDS